MAKSTVKESSPHFSSFMMVTGDSTNLKEWVKFGLPHRITKADSSRALSTETESNCSRMAISMKELILTTSPADKENTCGKMDPFMKESSKMDFEMVKAYGNPAHSPTKVTTSTIRRAAREFTIGMTVKLTTKGAFMKMSGMDTDRCTGTTESQPTKANGKRGFRMDMVRSLNLMLYHIK
jgi:hypothetical protein